MPPSYLLTSVTFLPLAGTTALFMLRADDHEWIRRIALAISLFEFALSLQLLRGFALTSANYQFVGFTIISASMASAYFWFCSPPSSRP